MLTIDKRYHNQPVDLKGSHFNQIATIAFDDL